jgi:hypothetical protein
MAAVKSSGLGYSVRQDAQSHLHEGRRGSRQHRAQARHAEVPALQLDTIAAYGKIGTGEKYLINRHRK